MAKKYKTFTTLIYRYINTSSGKLEKRKIVWSAYVLYIKTEKIFYGNICMRNRVVWVILSRRQHELMLEMVCETLKFYRSIGEVVLKIHPSTYDEKIKVKVLVNEEKSVSHLPTPSCSWFLLCFLRELLTNFYNIAQIKNKELLFRVDIELYQYGS